MASPIKGLGAAAAVFVTVAAVLILTGRDSGAAPGRPVITPAREGQRLTAQAGKELQKVRETGDPSRYLRAEAALQRAARLTPRDPDVHVGLGTLALARHDFRRALREGRTAERLGPHLVRHLAVVVDAEVELGRYAAAARALQRMIDLKPNLPSYARVSYLRELHGDLGGAVSAMRLAVSAGAGAPENVAYAQTLLGGLEVLRGRIGAARSAYATALQSFPRFLPAQAGLGRLDAAQGRYPPAIKRLSGVVDRLPFPEHVIALGEAQQAAGQAAAARDTFALVDAERRLLAANGVNTDAEIALFEADHGDRRRGVRLARSAWSRAPSVRSADALGWTLTRAGHPQQALHWARRAVSLGTRDPIVLTHAGLTAQAAGRRGTARDLLRRALALNPRFSQVWAPRARRALRSVS